MFSFCGANFLCGWVGISNVAQGRSDMYLMSLKGGAICIHFLRSEFRFAKIRSAKILANRLLLTWVYFFLCKCFLFFTRYIRYREACMFSFFLMFAERILCFLMFSYVNVCGANLIRKQTFAKIRKIRKHPCTFCGADPLKLKEIWHNYSLTCYDYTFDDLRPVKKTFFNY